MTDSSYTSIIWLTQGKYALVDNEDYEYLNQWKWCYVNGYAARSHYGGVVNGKPKINTIWMHRVLMATPKEMQTDHINGIRHDNRSKNLRICSAMQNSMNLKAWGRTSAFKGVSWRERGKKWVCSIQVNGKRTHLGSFTKELDAALAYQKAAKELQGEFRRI